MVTIIQHNVAKVMHGRRQGFITVLGENIGPKPVVSVSIFTEKVKKEKQTQGKWSQDKQKTGNNKVKQESKNGEKTNFKI